jgi:hypothetical protein
MILYRTKHYSLSDFLGGDSSAIISNIIQATGTNKELAAMKEWAGDNFSIEGGFNKEAINKLLNSKKDEIIRKLLNKDNK